MTLGSPRRLMFAGRFNEQKNLGFLLDVLEAVSDRPWRMNILGNGPLLEQVKQKIRDKGLSARVTLHGWVDPSVVEKTMLDSDIFILPSSSEGLPVAGIMALGSGTAILGSRVGGITDIVMEGVNGFLCEPGDINSFEKALREMVDSDDLLIEMKRRSRVLASKFDIEHVAASYEKLFEEVVSDGSEKVS